MTQKNSSFSLKSLSQKALYCLLFVLCASQVRAQYVDVPLTGFNNDVVANGTGATNTVSSGTIPGVTNPTIGIDGVGYTFIDGTYKWYSGSAVPACSLPASGTLPSLLTSGLSYQLQNYTGFNAMSIASNSFTGSVIPTTGSVSLTTPASYGVLKVLYETVQNTAGPTLTATITFTDASTQVISGISFVNWFTNTGTAYNNISRAQNVAPGAAGACATGPYLFEMSLNISPANFGKQVQSVSYSFSSAVGTSANTVNYFHLLAMGGIAPCVTPVDQPTVLNLTSPTGTTIAGNFTTAASAPTGYLTVIYPAGATPTDPVSGINYSAGNSLGLGKVVSSSVTTSFSATGLYPGISYDVYVYSYNGGGTCATVYNTTTPLTATITTSGTGASLLISPYGEGGFENGATLASNNWNVVNSGTNAWTVGTVPTGFTNQSAFISNNGGTAWAFTNSSVTASHIYKDITFPAGQSDITLSFNWKALGETSAWDAIIVYSCPTTITPVAGSPASTTGNVASWTGGAPTAIGAQLWNQGVNLQTFTSCLPAAFAGTTQRIVITWKNDGSGGVNPPAAIDNVAIVAATPAAPADQATALTLTAISTSQIDGSFTAATSAPTGYVVVRYPSGATPTDPVTGTTYSAGNALGTGTVVSVGTSLTFSATGLSGGTAYDFYVYDYSNSVCAGITYNTVSPLMGTLSTNPCGTMTSPVTVGPTGTYPTLSGAGGAIAAIQASGISAPMVIELESTYTAAGETYPIVINYNACVTATNSLTIRPDAATTTPLVISSASTTATIDMNGANNVTIDGRPGGIGTSKMLSVVNTSATAASAGNAILLRNDARNNTLTYLDLKASNLNPASSTGTSTIGAIPGAVAIHNATGGLTGNDNNTISYNDIHSNGSTGNLLNVGIYAYNNSTVGSALNNDNNTITYNNIYDIFHATTATAGVDILVGNNNYTITNNSYYKSSTTNYAYSAVIVHRGFWITPLNSAVASSGFDISNNYIGGTAPLCGGSSYVSTSTSANSFYGMDVSVGTASTTSIQNNLVSNFSVSTTSASSTSWIGINMVSGNIDCGTISGNLIGSTSTNGAISYTTSTSLGGVIGIRTGGGTLINVANNVVSGINIAGTTATISPIFNGINAGGGTTVNVTNNTIGSASLTNSINAITATTGTTAQTIRGIIVNGGTTSTVTGNLIANLNSNIVSTGSASHTVVGIAVTTSSSTVANNTIRNLTSSSQSTSGGSAPSVIGISYTATTAPAVIRGNTIHTLKNTNATTTSGPVVSGLYYGGASGTTNLIEKNTIHSLVLSSTTVSSSSAISGMDIGTGGATIRNNMIRLGYDENGNSITTACLVRGISKNSNIANVYFNSVYIGGTGVLSTVAANTFAFTRTAAANSDDIRNNIFVNNRSNASTGGKHYQISLSSIATLNLNYNSYYGNGTGSVFALNVAADVATYSPGWFSTDISSQISDPQFINPDGSATTGDLHINPAIATVIEQQGQNIVSVTEDIDGDLRISNSPEDIGADAGNFTPVNPCSGMPATGTAAFTVTTAICGTGTKTMILSGVTSQPGLTYQWQESLTGLAGSFSDVTTGIGGTTVGYTTATLNAASPLYFQCIVKCISTGDSSISNTIQAVVNAAPTLTVTPATGTSVCSGSNVDLEASGAATYTWACNPGVTGYPIVSLLSTPNNLAKITSRPRSTLSSSVAAPPATVSTPTWIYTVTGTDAAGCTSTSSVTLNVITTATVPLTLTYVTSVDPVCEPGIPVTFTLANNGTIGSGQWVYNWYDNAGTTLLQTNTNALATDTYTPATATANGLQQFTAKVSNTACPASYAVASPSYYVGFTSLNVATNSNCGDNGQIAVYPEGQTDFSDWYVNDFNTGLLGAAFDGLYGTATVASGRCNITTQTNSQNGTLFIRNPSNINTNNLQVDFLLSTAPLGFAFNILGADGLAWSYAGDVWQGQLTPATGGFQAEGGSGTGFKLAFDATANGAGNTPGVYLMYNCTTPDQGPTSPGVIAFKQGSFWQGLVNAPVSIQISDNGFVTVKINNQVIFDHIPLPTAYLTANKSNWAHAFTARTGGSNQLHAIDNLSIRYNAYEYSNNSTTGNDGSWQTSNLFTGLAAGTYPIWVRKLSDPTCFSFTGNSVIGVDPSPSSAITVPSAGYSDVVCYNTSTSLTTNIYVPGATFLWEESSSPTGPWSACPGTNNEGTYVTGGLITNTYYRLTFTCPSSTPVTSTPLLVTVNAGSIASTNSPVLVNCIGDVATLNATPGASTTCVWYNVATGGSPLASGNTYTITASSLPVTYYVEPVTTIYSNHYYNGGQTVIANTFGSSSSGTAIATRFSTTASIIIDSIKVLPSATGTLTVALQAAGSATNISTFTFTITAAMVGNFVNIPCNLTVGGSGSYQLTTSGVACAYYSTYTGTYTAPYMFLGGVFSVTGASTTATGAASTSVYGTAFRIAISSSCSNGGTRVPVIVQANPTNAVNTTVSASTTCLNVVQTLSATSATTYSNYSWTPLTDLYEDLAATIPYTGTNASTVYLKASTAGVKTYTVSTVGSGCTNVATATISVTPSPSLIVTSTPTFVCNTGNVQLNASVGGAYCTAPYTTGTGLNDYITNVTLGTINNSTGASASPYNTYYSALNTNLTAGSTYTVTGTINNGGTENVAVWIDYNHDGTFDAAEKLGEQQTLSFSIGFTVPASALNGATRMRVRNVYFTTGILPCNSYTYGEVEDYNVTISGGLTASGYAYDWSANSTYLSATNISDPMANGVSTSQVYSVTVTDIASGCTSVGTVPVAVNVSTTSTISYTNCGPFTWNGNTYTTSGAYTYTTINAGGCDSVVTLNLTVNSATTSSTTIDTCGSYTWNGTTYTTSGVYSYTTINALGCDSVATLNLTLVLCDNILNLTCFIQGYYDAGISGMLPVLDNQFEPTTPGACDSIDVELHDASFPYGMVRSDRVVLQQNGTATCTFSPISGNYYIVVKHRNALQTWSANPVAFGLTPTTYNFSNGANKAYGDNQIEVDFGVWAFYSGDVEVDENMDLLDIGLVENDINNFGFGYLPTDINGDGNVDLLDSPPVETNVNNFVFSIHP